MRQLLGVVLIVMATSSLALANWQLYHKTDKVVASFDYLTFAPFRNQPSVWVRWHYVTPRNAIGGMKIHFTAECRKHQLFEIANVPYDRNGNFLSENRHEDTPKEYPLQDPLNSATYKLLCR